MNELGRFLVDYENPDAGIGHSLGHVNNAIKICLRHDLQFAYSESQVLKSSKDQWGWRLRQWIRRLTLRQVYETHDIGNDINTLFAFAQHTKDRDWVEHLLQKGQLKLVLLPETKISIPSNAQDDEAAYEAVDAVIHAHPEDGVVFRLPDKRTGDFEYQSSLSWFRRCYEASGSNKFPEQYAPAQSDALKVAIHIRRGDLLPGRQFDDLAKRMLPDAWYQCILSQILDRCGEKHIVVYVVSEGLDGHYCSEKGLVVDWNDLLPKNRCTVVELIDKPFVPSFRVLVSADILIGSKSGMTHLAGMLGGHIKFVPRMWHSYRGASSVLELDEEIDAQTMTEVARLTDTACRLHSLHHANRSS
ncbi:hypothetical protein [Rhodoferax sp.]|uniref:hypothetical protein n=1 Tax=Rhodoferax sp. TaxID=50421 RepID=UPI0025F1E606|nr:hypothetical protein [Rhodoferax sp.]